MIMGALLQPMMRKGELLLLLEVSMEEEERSPLMTRTMSSILFRMLQIKIEKDMRN